MSHTRSYVVFAETPANTHPSFHVSRCVGPLRTRWTVAAVSAKQAILLAGRGLWASDLGYPSGILERRTGGGPMVYFWNGTTGRESLFWDAMILREIRRMMQNQARPNVSPRRKERRMSKKGKTIPANLEGIRNLLLNGRAAKKDLTARVFDMIVDRVGKNRVITSRTIRGLIDGEGGGYVSPIMSSVRDLGLLERAPGRNTRPVRYQGTEFFKAHIAEANGRPDVTPSSDPLPTMKLCSGKCGEEKSLDDFHVRSDAPDGHTAQCKDCRNDADRERAAVKVLPSKEETIAEYAGVEDADFDRAIRKAQRAGVPRITTPDGFTFEVPR